MSATVSPLPSGVYPINMVLYNDYLYIIATDMNLYKVSTLNSIQNYSAELVVSLGYMMVGLTIYNNNIYFKDITGNIYIIDISNPSTPTLLVLISTSIERRQLAISNNFLYTISTDGITENLIRIDLTTNEQTTLPISIFGPISIGTNILINNNVLYILNKPITSTYCQLINVDLNNFTADTNTWINLTNASTMDNGFAINNNNLYISYVSTDTTCKVVEYELHRAIIITTDYVPNISSGINGQTINSLIITNNNIYAIYSITDSPYFQPEIYGLTLLSTPVACFKEHSKILCFIEDKEIYLPIQDIKKGYLVKTLKNGYIPVNMLGYRSFFNKSELENRTKNQLYLCSSDNYPEVFEDLVMTGCHSILVDSFNDDVQKKQVMGFFGRIHVTDDKYRLPSCIDERAKIYEPEGVCLIYHLALNNVNELNNYGIYANGLLVESCSKYYLEKRSGMTLI